MSLLYLSLLHIWYESRQTRMWTVAWRVQGGVQQFKSHQQEKCKAAAFGRGGTIFFQFDTCTFLALVFHPPKMGHGCSYAAKLTYACFHPLTHRVFLAVFFVPVREVGGQPRAGSDTGAGGGGVSSRRQAVFPTNPRRRLWPRALHSSAVTWTTPAASTSGTRASTGV